MDVCQLCHRTCELVDSHFIPAGFYRDLREPSEKLQLVIVTPESTAHSSKQVRAHVFCNECERRLNVNGEDWMLKHCYHAGRFPLRDKLMAGDPAVEGRGLKAYAARRISTIDVQNLVYFGASIFWRGSLRQWRLNGKRFQPYRFGKKYEEEFRLFLLGQGDFPSAAAMLITVSSRPVPLKAIVTPLGGKGNGHQHYSHRFAISGITFMLGMGRLLPEVFRRLCVLRSPEQWIIIADDMERTTIGDFAAASKTSRVSEKIIAAEMRLRAARDQS